jgi:undecaprenyl-diphosphatase
VSRATEGHADPNLDSRSPSAWRRWLDYLIHHGQVRLAEFGAIVLVGFVAAAVLLNAFAWIASEVLEQDTLSIDLAVLTFLRGFSSPRLTLVAEAISALGSEAILLFGAVLLGVLLWQRRWGAALSLVIVTVGAQLLNNVLKDAFQRERPTPVAGFIDAQQFSFPSGHAMVAAAFYLFVAYLLWRLVRGPWRGVLVVSLLILVLLIGLSRLYLQVHYLSDVIAGFLAGALWTDAVILGGSVLNARTRSWRRGADPPRPSRESTSS